MSLDDLFKHRGHGHHDDHHDYYGGHHDSHYHHGGIDRYLYLFEKLKGNRKLWLFLSFAAIVVIIIFIVAIIMLIPLIIKMFDAVQKNGIKGLLESAKPILDLLWNGSGK